MYHIGKHQIIQNSEQLILNKTNQILSNCCNTFFKLLFSIIQEVNNKQAITGRTIQLFI